MDDGEHWQSLRLNMPATSIRDLIIKDDDLVVGTHGRSFWILDDITSLRQLSNETIGKPVVLYKPADTYRIRRSMWTDTPLPQEEPAGENPPDGAILDYYLKDSCKEVTLEIYDSNKKLVRKFSSNDTSYRIPELNIPLYWIQPEQKLSSNAGSHRFVWDLHYTRLNIPPSFPMGAVYEETAPSPTSPWVMPGTYTLLISADGKQSIQPLLVKMDPRVNTSMKGLRQQHDLSFKCYANRVLIMKSLNELHELRAKIESKLQHLTGTAASVKQVDNEMQELENGSGQSFSKLNASFASLLDILEGSDTTPTTQVISAVNRADSQLTQMLSKLKNMEKKIE